MLMHARGGLSSSQRQSEGSGKKEGPKDVHISNSGGLVHIIALPVASTITSIHAETLSNASPARGGVVAADGQALLVAMAIRLIVL